MSGPRARSKSLTWLAPPTQKCFKPLTLHVFLTQASKNELSDLSQHIFCAPHQLVGSTLPTFSLLWLLPTRSRKVKRISLLCPMPCCLGSFLSQWGLMLHCQRNEECSYSWMVGAKNNALTLPVLPANAVPMFYLHQLSYPLDSYSNDSDEYGPPLPLIHHYPSNQDKLDVKGDDDKDDNSSIPPVANKDLDEEDDDNDSSAPPNANRMHPLDSPRTNVHSQGFSHHSSSEESPWPSPDLSI